LYLGNIDRRMGCPRCGEVFIPFLAVELCDELLLLRTKVGASEKEVSDRGISVPIRTTGGGAVIGDARLV
jgi:hypothetical protein